jgi:hypothetical protein
MEWVRAQDCQLERSPTKALVLKKPPLGDQLAVIAETEWMIRHHASKSLG